MEDIGQLLKEHPFLEGMDAKHIALLSDLSRKEHFESGNRIFREGEPAERMYLVISGKVALEVFNLDQGSIPIQAIGPAEVLGWSWLVPPYRWRFDAKAVQPTDAITIDAKGLLTLCEKHTDLGFELMKRMAVIVEQRLNATKEQLLDAYVFRK